MFESLIHNPLVIYLAVIVFSSLLYTMPKPGPQSPWIYVWLYRVLHLLGANIDRVKESIKSATGIDLTKFTDVPASSLSEEDRPRLPTAIPQAASGPQAIASRPEPVLRE